jgi:2-methylisocitrate lyase-like PEP mutase family enzyme
MSRFWAVRLSMVIISTSLKPQAISCCSRNWAKGSPEEPSPVGKLTQGSLARADAYWLSIGEPEQRLYEAIERGNAYLEAGADCVFVPGRMSREVIRDLAKGIKGPLNIIATPLGPNVAELETLGVSRLSIGSGAVRASLGITQRLARELKAQGALTSMVEAAISYGEANKLFSDKIR